MTKGLAMSSNFGFTSFSNLGSIVQQVQQVASQVSNQINQNIDGIQDVASNLEQAFKPVTGSNGSVGSPTQESCSQPCQNNSSNSSRRSSANTEKQSDTDAPKERKSNVNTGTSKKESDQTPAANSPRSSNSSSTTNTSQATNSEGEDFVYVEKPTSEEGYQESAQSLDPGKAKTSRLDLSGRQGFGNPFGYLMGNGGLCGGRADNKASSTSGASPFSDQNQRDQRTRAQNQAGSKVTDMAVCCDICNTKFGFLTRKKTCSECRLLFCSSCITSMAAKKVPDPKHNNGSPGLIKVCARCQVLLKTPPIKADLMELRVKDLQRYLMSNKISTKDCVEKKDLVELVMKENGGQIHSSQRQPDTRERPSSSTNNNSSSRPSSNTSSSNTRNARYMGPVEREQQNFPRSYVQSTHRQDFFERFTANNDADEELEEQENDNAPTKSSASWMSDSEEQVQDKPSKCDNSSRSSSTKNTGPGQNRIDSNTDSSFTPVEAFESANSNERIHSSHDSKVTEETPVEPMDVSSLPTSPTHQRNSHSQSDPVGKEEISQEGAANDEKHKYENKDMDTDQKISKAELDKDQEKSEERLEGAVGGLGVNAPSPISSSKLSPSPKRFAKQDLVYLSEIDSIEELNELSATQLKKLLAMNRVTFKGVVEKEELLKIVTRLWKQEQKAEEGKDCIRDEELCKICMDHPVDCVMLECGHMCTCTRCGKQMAECPICRQYVVRVVRTFKA